MIFKQIYDLSKSHVIYKYIYRTYIVYNLKITTRSSMADNYVIVAGSKDKNDYH